MTPEHLTAPLVGTEEERLTAYQDALENHVRPRGRDHHDIARVDPLLSRRRKPL